MRKLFNYNEKYYMKNIGLFFSTYFDSSETHKEILENWDTSVFSPSYKIRLDGAISNCLDGSWKDNNDWVNDHFDEFYQWVCDNNDCDGINLESNEV